MKLLARKDVLRSRQWLGLVAIPLLLLAQRRLAQGERSPAFLCQSMKPVHGQDGRIVQIMGRSAGMDEYVNRKAEMALRQPA
jgi:hypothetical protein